MRPTKMASMLLGACGAVFVAFAIAHYFVFGEKLWPLVLIGLIALVPTPLGVAVIFFAARGRRKLRR